MNRIIKKLILKYSRLIQHFLSMHEQQLNDLLQNLNHAEFATNNTYQLVYLIIYKFSSDLNLLHSIIKQDYVFMNHLENNNIFQQKLQHAYNNEYNVHDIINFDQK